MSWLTDLLGISRRQNGEIIDEIIPQYQPLDDTEKCVYRIVEDILHVPRHRLRPERTLDYLGADSLDTVAIVFSLEEKFDIPISDEDTDFPYRGTLKQICDYINTKQSVKALT